MKTAVVVLALAALFGLSCAQLPICDPARTPMGVENFKVVENKYDASSKKSLMTIEFENPTKNKPTAGCVEHYLVKLNVDNKQMEEKKIGLSNPRESPIRATFTRVNPGSKVSFAARGVTKDGKVGLTFGSRQFTAQDAPTGSISPK